MWCAARLLLGCVLLSTIALAAPPPGIDPTSIAVRPAGDARALVPLADVVPPRLLPMIAPAANQPGAMERLAADPEDLKARLARGRAAVERRRWLEAVSELEAARAAGVIDIELNRLLATACSALGSPARAAEEWRRVLLREPDDPDALFEVGIALVDAREGELALDPLLRLWRQLEPEAEHAEGGREVAPVQPDQPDQPDQSDQSDQSDMVDTEPTRPARRAQRVIAAYVLAEALWQSGFDRAGADAAVEAARSVSDPRFAPSERTRPDQPLDGRLQDRVDPRVAALPERLAARVDEVRRRADVLLRSAAEAFLRCGECDAALDALDRAERHERPTAVQRARRLAAYRCAGRPEEALRWWIRSLGSAPDRVERGDTAVAEWLAEWLAEGLAEVGDDAGSAIRRADPAARSALAAALRDGTAALAMAHPRNANLLAVAAATHPPEERARLLREGAVAIPDDRVLLGQALRATASLPDGPGAAIQLALDRVQSTPEASAAIAAQLSTLPLTPRHLLAALEGERASGIAAALLRAELGVLWDDPSALADANAIVADDPSTAVALLALRARAAAATGAPEHAQAVAADARALGDPVPQRMSAPLVEAVAEALLRAGEPEAAWNFVEPLVRLVAVAPPTVDRPGELGHPELDHAEPRRPRLVADAALLAVAAEVAIATAAALPDDSPSRRARLAAVERLARAAIVEDPGAELAWRVLLTLVDPDGTLLPDSAASAALTAELERLVRGVTAEEEIVARTGLEPLLRRIEIQQAAGEGRRKEAIAALMQLVEADGTDASVLELLGAIWRQGGESTEAEEWFRLRSDAQPSNPLFARAAVDAAIAAGRAEDAVHWLRTRSHVDSAPTAAPVDGGGPDGRPPDHRPSDSPDDRPAPSVQRAPIDPMGLIRPIDPIGDALLGRALAAAGELPAARAHDRARLERRPEGPQRDLELARLEAGGDRIELVVQLLEAVADRAAAPAQRRGALVIAAGVDRLALRDPRRIDALVVDLVDRVLADDPALPLSVHTAALVAEVRRGADDATLRRTLDRALASAPGRTGSPEAIRGWLGMAQAMVGLSRGDLAAIALRRRLDEGPPPEADAAILLRSAAITADIAARDVEGTLARLPFLRLSAVETGYPPIVPEGDDVAGGEPGAAREIGAPDPPRQDPPAQMPATVPASGLTEDRLDAELLVWLSTRWTLLDDDTGAEALLREALRRAPGHGMASNNLGWMLLELDDAAEPALEVVELIESAARALPASASVVDSLGWLRYRQGQLLDEGDRLGAVSLLRRAVVLAGDQVAAELLDHLGDALWAAGEEGEALSMWRRAVTLIDRTAPRDQMLTVLLNLQQREYGLVLVDPRDLYQRLYGRVRDRMVEKLLAARGSVPPE